MARQKNFVKGTFLDETTNPDFSSSDAAFFGVEFDFVTSYKSGARLGPKAILDASRQIEFEAPFIGMRLDEKIKIHNLGMLSYAKPGEKNTEAVSKKMVKDVEGLSLRALNENKFLFVLGGDHSISNGIANAVAQKFSTKDVCWVCFDAHLDLRDKLEEMKLSHGTIARRVHEHGFNQLFIGPRDSVSSEEVAFITQNNLSKNIFFCPLLPKAFYSKQKNSAWIKKENLLFDGSYSKKQLKAMLSTIKQRNIWLEIDIDVLDANEFLGTGTPMPGGLSTKKLNELLFEITSFAKKQGKKITGFSIVEVFPLMQGSPKNYSSRQAVSTACEMKAALLCYNILLYNFLEKFR